MCRFSAFTLVAVVVIWSTTVIGQAGLQIQLAPAYKKWLTEDVRYLITAQERKDFMLLTTDQDRDGFIAAFWERRNPYRGSEENAFKEEHYRRLAFANEHFAAKRAGFKTDRGRIYIVYGPPDSIDTRPTTQAAPSQEVWFYRDMKGSGNSVRLKFVDECRCGDLTLETPLPNNLRDVH